MTQRLIFIMESTTRDMRIRQIKILVNDQHDIQRFINQHLKERPAADVKVFKLSEYTLAAVLCYEDVV
jgi:hypothetical protein